jgi:hypothetical protein
VSLTAALSGLCLPITGLSLHHLCAPPVSVAQHAWMAAHNVLGLVFVVFAVWHILLNRRPLGTYLRQAVGARGAGAGHAVPLLAAIAVVGLALLFAGHAFLVE